MRIALGECCSLSRRRPKPRKKTRLFYRFLCFGVGYARSSRWIAKELALFEKHGLNVNLIYIASGVVSVNALLGGSVDIMAALMAMSEATWIGKTNKEQAFRVYRKYMKVEDTRLLESMHKNYLLGTIPAKLFPREEAIQNDIEDLSQIYAHLKGKKATEFLDISLLKELENEGFYTRL